MTSDKRLHRRSIRLPEYDYTQAGVYYITICSHEREHIFGEICDGQMVLNAIGQIVADEWSQTAQKRPNIALDAYVIMPNHVHGIIVISESTNILPPTIERFGQPTSNSIPTIVRLFKSAATKRINIFRNTWHQPVWQRNYYEHVVRGEADLDRIRTYIANNPVQWAEDRENEPGTAMARWDKSNVTKRDVEPTVGARCNVPLHTESTNIRQQSNVKPAASTNANQNTPI